MAGRFIWVGDMNSYQEWCGGKGALEWGLIALAFALLVGWGCAGDEILVHEEYGEGDAGIEDRDVEEGDIQQAGDDTSRPMPDATSDADGDEDTSNGPIPDSCQESHECPGDALVCDSAAQVCVVACESDADCGSQFCDPDSGLCRPCHTDDHCEAGVCDQSGGHICRECLGSSHCEGDLVCDANYECVVCATHSHCPDPDAPFCNAAREECVRCLETSHCSSGEVCHTDLFECVGCVTDGDCPDGVCDGDTCVECLGDGDCDGGACLTAQKECVQCTDQSHCGANETCDVANNLCVGCVTDGDCDQGYCRTTDSVCVDCYDDGHCPGQVCDTSDAVCRDCLSDGDCPGQICSSNHTCLDCEVDGHCGGGQVCTGDNTCVDCQYDSHCGANEVCTNYNVCVECLNNTDCPTGQLCRSDNTCGGCTSDAGCPSGDYCDTTVNECVDCLNDNLHCPINGQICENQMCVQNPDTSTCQYGSDCPSGLCYATFNDCYCEGHFQCSAGQVCCYDSFTGDTYCTTSC